jgi:hypothetical protein
MQRYGLSMAFIVFAVAGDASAQTVKVHWDRATDFTRYNTYKWTKIPSPRTPTPEIEQLIHYAVDMQLEAKGLKEAQNSEPDLYVGYSVTLGPSKKHSAAVPVADSSAWQTGNSWSEHNPSDKAARKGTLNIDIAEAKKTLLVWRGSVMTEVGDSMNDARVKISKGVSKAFAQYPPPAK